MKIGYVTSYDSSDIHSWSGLGLHIGQSLEEQGLQLNRIGPLDTRETVSMRLKRRFYTRCLKENYSMGYEPSRLKRQAREIDARLRAEPVDLVFSPHTMTLTYSKKTLPRVLWGDCTVAGMIDYYPDYSNLCRESLRRARTQERQALEAFDLLIFTSQWAADSAINFHGIPEERIRVVPFGANIECRRTEADIEAAIAARPNDRCRLFFLGKVWERKGGAVALEVARQLNEAGVATELVLAGSTPPPGASLPDYVRPLGFVSKSTPEGRRQIDRLFAESHFLILPSRAEAFGVVFCEASSFGLPSLASRTGGIPSVVRDGVNGQTFPVEGAEEAYVAFIRECMADRAKYEALARSAFQEYRSRLNWQTSGATVAGFLRDIVAR